MATTVGDVAVTVGANIAPLQKNMRKAGRTLTDFGNTARRSALRIGGIAAAATAAGAALGGAMFVGATRSAQQMQNLARISSTSTSEFARLAFAAQQVGIENEKLADIFKDMNDRVGDFNSTGAGPMADFFEQIAPKVGVTADQFARLSGPEALQLYVNSLEKANLSQADMTFYMEAIASDSTKLLPLLRNNGAAMEEQANKAERLGIALSDVDYAQLEDARRNIDAVTSAFGGLANQLSSEFAGIFNVLAEDLIDVMENTDNYGEISKSVFQGVASATGAVADGFFFIRTGIAATSTAAKMMEVGFLRTFTAVNVAWDATATGIGEGINWIIEQLNKLPGVDLGTMVTGQREFTKNLSASLEQAEAELAQSTGNLGKLLGQEKPSVAIEAWAANVIEESDKAAAEIRKNIQDQDGGVLGMPTPEQAQSLADQLLPIEQDYQQKSADQYMKFLNKRAQAADEYQQSQRIFTSENNKLMLRESSRALGQLTSLMDTESKKQFEIGKAAAISQTIIDTYAAAQSAYKALAGIPVVGPGLGAAAAAAAVVGGMARVQSISSRQFSSSGAAGADPGAAATAGAGGQGGGQQQAQQSEPTQIASFNIQGDFFGRDQVIGLIGQINEVVGDGVRLETS